jgi:hypothetical protein
MPDTNLERRVAILEANMKQFEDVPARLVALDNRVAAVESQIVQLRGDMQSEFSAVRTEMRTVEGNLRTEMRSVEENLRTEMRALNEETRTEMRVLHEDVISRLALLKEAPAVAGARRVSRRPRRKKR